MATADYSVSGSVGHISPVCSNCIETGTSKTAKCFCSECDLALCGTCETLHRKFASSHEIEHYDNEGSEAGKEQLAVRCSAHRGQEAALFCKDHDSLICSACKEGEHSGCSVQPISEACDKLDVYMERCETLDKLTTLESRIEELSRAKRLKRNICKTKFEERKSDIKTLRKKFVSVFDRYEGEMESKEEKCIASLSSFIRKYDVLSNNVRGEIQSLESKQDKEALFKQLVASKGVIKRTSEGLASNCETITSFDTAITEDRTLPPLLDQLSRLTHKDVAESDEALEEENENEPKKSFLNLKSFTTIKTVDPKVRSDKDPLWITGCCWLPDQNGIIICDYESKNKTIKILDKDLNVTFTATCPSDPFDVALINETSAIVTLPCTKEVQFIEIKPGFKFNEKKNINFKSYGVGVHDKHILVCGYESSTKGVKLLTLTGDDASFIPNVQTGYPSKLCIDSGGKVYHTGGYATSVYITCVTIDGHGFFSVSSNELHDPQGIVCDEVGNVLVCDENKKCVQVISSIGVCGSIVITDNEYKPMAMCINKSYDLLIIAWRKSSNPYNSKLTLYRLNYV